MEEAGGGSIRCRPGTLTSASMSSSVPHPGARQARDSGNDDLQPPQTQAAFGLMMSLNMLIEFGDAFDFTGADVAGWCTQVGFHQMSRSFREKS